MNEYRAFIGLGSNLGDRHGFLSKAAADLENTRDTRVVWYSSVYESDPVGNPDQPAFLNAVAEVETRLTPPDLMKELQGIEEAVGRIHHERWGPREIDLDILLYDGLVHQDERLSVPHPELEKRRFVLVPLRELAPDLVHPVSGLTVEELAAECAGQGRIKKTSYKILV
jgi:2-amino-4-hydroxy-6-hydroxymethyldihydropteridine diphosphokinase